MAGWRFAVLIGVSQFFVFYFSGCQVSGMRVGLIVVILVVVIGAVVAGINFFAPRPQTEIVTSGENPLFSKANNWWEANPYLDAKAMTPGAKAKVPLETFEFGTMERGTKMSHGFIIRNEGNVPMKLAKGRTQCKCTLAALKSDEVPPGGEAVIELEWEPKELGEFFQQAIIYTSDPDLPEIKLGAKGMLTPRVSYSPEGGWLLGILGEEPVPLEGFIFSQIVEDLEIKEITTTSEYVKVEVARVSPDQAPFPHAKIAYKITGHVFPPDKVGQVRDEVIVVTSDENSSPIRFPVAGERLGPLTLVGPGWFAQKSMFNLGKITGEKGKTIRYTVLIDAKLGEITFSDIQVNPGFLEVSLKPEGSDGTRNKFALELKIPPGSPAGVWATASLGKLSMKSNHPDLEELTFNISMEIK